MDGEVGGTRASPANVRWGLGDFAWLYVAGVVASLVGASVGLAISGDTEGHTGALTIGLAALGQFGGWIGGLVVVSRTKGSGSIGRDFGVRLRARRIWALFAGAGVSLLLGWMVAPIIWLAHDEKQQVVDDLKSAHGAKLVVFVVIAAVLAPIAEETMFRGLLLRALRRRYEPWIAIGAQALVFALAHPLLDPTLGTFAIVPALFALGTINGIAAETVGDLSVSIPIHMGFNLLTIVSVLALARVI